MYYTQPNLPLSSVTFFEDVLRRRQTILSCKIAKRNNETECNVKAETSSVDEKKMLVFFLPDRRQQPAQILLNQDSHKVVSVCQADS